MLCVLGIILLLFLVRDILHSAIPRGMSTRLCMTPFLVHRVLWPPFSFIASRISSPVYKAEVLSLFAPLSLLAILLFWIFIVVVGFGLISLGIGSDYSPVIKSFVDACYVSANAVLTIGPASDCPPRTEMAKFLMLAGALTGLLLIASAISLIFGLIAAIQPREALVSIVFNLAGAPPSGIGILETYSRMHGREFLPTFFDECHHWCADVLESHRAFPILPYFRSNEPLTSWLTTLGAILDSIGLMVSVGSDESCFSARLTHQIGCKLVNEFASLYKLTLSEPGEISDAEFHELYLRLQSAGYSSSSEGAARSNFRLMRQEYCPALKALCDYLVVPAPSTNGDRSQILPDVESESPDTLAVTNRQNDG